MLERAKEIVEIQSRAIANLPIDSSIEKCVKMFVACKGKVVFTGMGKAGLVARKIAATLSSTGTPAIFLHPGEASHGDLGMITNDDIIVAMSNSGKTYEVLLTLELCQKAFTCPIIGITSNPEADMAKFCSLILKIGEIKEVCPFGLAPTTSTTTMMVLGDVLSVLTMEEKKFTLFEYAQRHHGGYIGSLIREN